MKSCCVHLQKLTQFTHLKFVILFVSKILQKFKITYLLFGKFLSEFPQKIELIKYLQAKFRSCIHIIHDRNNNNKIDMMISCVISDRWYPPRTRFNCYSKDRVIYLLITLDLGEQWRLWEPRVSQISSCFKSGSCGKSTGDRIDNRLHVINNSYKCASLSCRKIVKKK